MATVASQLRSANRKYGPIIAGITRSIVLGGGSSFLRPTNSTVRLQGIMADGQPVRNVQDAARWAAEDKPQVRILTPLDDIKDRIFTILPVEARSGTLEQKEAQLKLLLDQAFSSFEQNSYILSRGVAAYYSAFISLDSEMHFGLPWGQEQGFFNPQVLANFKAKADLIPWVARFVDRYLKEEARIKQEFLTFANSGARGAEDYFRGRIYDSPLFSLIDWYPTADDQSTREAIFHIWSAFVSFSDDRNQIQDWMAGARPRPDISSIKSPFTMRQKSYDWHEEEWARRQEEENKKKISTYAGGGTENIVPAMKIGEFLFYELTKKEQLQYESACMQHCIGWDSQKYCVNMLAGEGRAFAVYREGDPLEGRCSGQTPAATMYFDKANDFSFDPSRAEPFQPTNHFYWKLNQIHGHKNIRITDARLRKAAAIFILSQGFSPSSGWLDAETSALAPYFQGGRWTGTTPTLDGLRGVRRGGVFYGAPRRRMR